MAQYDITMVGHVSKDIMIYHGGGRIGFSAVP